MKLSSILLSVAEIIIFACWFFFPLQPSSRTTQWCTTNNRLSMKRQKNRQKLSFITKMNVVDVWVWFGDDRVLLWFCRHKRSWKYKIKNILCEESCLKWTWTSDLSVFWWITKQLYSRFSWNYVSRIQNRTVWRSATLRGEEGFTRPSCWASFSSGAAALDLCDALRRRKYHRKLKCGAVTSEVTSRRQRVRRTQ